MARRRRRSFKSTFRRARRRGRRAFSAAAGSTSLKGALLAGAGGTAGFVGVDMLVDRVPGLNSLTGWGRIAGKAALAYFGGKMLAKYSPTLGRALIAGGMVRAGVDAYNAVRAQAGGGNATGAQAAALRGLGNLYMLPGDEGVMGLGSYEDESNYVNIS